MNKNFGSVFKALRCSKNYKLKEVASKTLSISQISKFENGSSSLTIDRFFEATQNIQVSLSEFETAYQNYLMMPDFVLRNDYEKAFGRKDISKIKEYISKLNYKTKQYPNNKRWPIENIVLENMLAAISDFKLSGKEIDRNQSILESYFNQIDFFSKYEIWVLSHTHNLLDPKTKRNIIQKSFHNTQFISGNVERRRLMLKLYIDLLKRSLEDGEMVESQIYIQFLEDMGITGLGTTEYDLWERLVVKFYKGMYKVKLDLDKKTGLDEMGKVLSILGFLDAYGLKSRLEKEMKSFIKNNP